MGTETALEWFYFADALLSTFIASSPDMGDEPAHHDDLQSRLPGVPFVQAQMLGTCRDARPLSNSAAAPAATRHAGSLQSPLSTTGRRARPPEGAACCLFPPGPFPTDSVASGAFVMQPSANPIRCHAPRRKAGGPQVSKEALLAPVPEIAVYGA